MRWKPLAFKAEEEIIPFDAVKSLDISDIEEGVVVLTTHDGGSYTARGFDAVEAVWAWKPSALEGRRLKWKKGSWAFHNVVAHPVMQCLAWMGFTRLAVWLHDATVPAPRGLR